MSANKDTEFPEPIDIRYSPISSYFIPEYYWMEDVDDWFKRCIEEMPIYPKWTQDLDDVIHFANNVDGWQEKWFSQFRNKGQK